MVISRKDIGKRVTDGDRSGVLRDLDLKWVDPAWRPGQPRIYAQAWVLFDGQGERQVHPNSLKLAVASDP